MFLDKETELQKLEIFPQKVVFYLIYSVLPTL